MAKSKKETKVAPAGNGTWKNRIVGQGEVQPDQLLANPKNWRIHPKEQQDALTSVLDRVGWVQQVVVNQQTNFVVDGHLRVSMAISKGEPTMPVVYVDLTEEEESLVLATIDPLAALARTDEDQLQELVKGLNVDQDKDLQELFETVRLPIEGIATGDGPHSFENVEAASEDFHCPKCGYEWSGNATPQGGE
jgi:hypothetical protein